MFLPPFRIRKRFHFDFWFIFTTDIVSIYLLIAIFIDWKHRWRNTIYIQEIEIRFYVISLGMMILFSAHKKYLLHIYATLIRKGGKNADLIGKESLWIYTVKVDKKEHCCALLFSFKCLIVTSIPILMSTLCLIYTYVYFLFKGEYFLSW